MISLKKLLGPASVMGLLAFVSFPNDAGAATFSPCAGTGYDISGNMSGAIACTISDAEQDFLNTDPITVNDPPGFFNETNWVFGGKIGVNTGYNGEGEGVSGTYDVTGVVNTALTKVLAVFKDGNGTTLVGYLLDPVNGLSGDWSSPFVEPPFDFPGSSPKDVSHISIYTADCPEGSFGCGPSTSPVPVPAGLPLMLTAMGIGVYMRKRACKSA